VMAGLPSGTQCAALAAESRIIFVISRSSFVTVSRVWHDSGLGVKRADRSGRRIVQRNMSMVHRKMARRHAALRRRYVAPQRAGPLTIPTSDVWRSVRWWTSPHCARSASVAFPQTSRFQNFGS
jgi:hypothetical protein